jgi:hypothetical protein
MNHRAEPPPQKTQFHCELAQKSAKKLASIFAALLLVGVAMAASIGITPAYAEISANEVKEAFGRLATMEGRWEAREGKRTTQIAYVATSAGTAITESWTVNGKPHSITVYTLGPDGLLATHYCRQGNQPVLKLDSMDENGTIHFRFHSASNLASTADEHLHELWLFRSAANRLQHEELYLADGKGEPLTRHFRRVSGK